MAKASPRLHIPDAWRQSSIAKFDACPLSLRFDLETDGLIRQLPGYIGIASARGTLAHRFAAEALQQLIDHDEPEMPIDVGMELLARIIAQRDVPDDEVVQLPMNEIGWLRVIAIRWCRDLRISLDRVVNIEQRLYADIEVPGPNGTTYTRTITGQPDVVLSGPGSDGATMLDYKSGFAQPSRKKVPTEDNPNPTDKLSDMGYVQQTVYGWLAMKQPKWAFLNSVTQRELYLMADKEDNVREATVERFEMERIEDALAAVISRMDAAIESYPDLVKRQAAARRAKKPVPMGRFFPIPGTQCFGGETRFLTATGVRELRDCVGERVRVLNRNGEWEDGEVRSFGIQQLLRTTFSDGYSVRATPDHRWWTMLRNPTTGAWEQSGGRVTTVEMPRVPLAQHAQTPDADIRGIRHGIVFGDGHRRVGRGWSQVLLQPHKAQLARFWDGETVERWRGSKGGSIQRHVYDPVKRYKDGTARVTLQPLEFKDLPEVCTPEYARGFIAGLLATDGTVKRDGNVSISCEGRERAERIAEIARLGGCVVSAVKLSSDRTPSVIAGVPREVRPRELMIIKIKPATALVLRWQHVARLKEKNQMRSMYRDIVNLEDDGVEEVFCVVVPGSESFTLANGVVTSNCGLCVGRRHCPTRDHFGQADTLEEAQRLAREWYLSGEARTERTPYVKGWVNEHGPIPIAHAKGRRVIGYKNGSRTLSLFEPDDAAEGPLDPLMAPPSEWDEVLLDAARGGGVLLDG